MADKSTIYYDLVRGFLLGTRQPVRLRQFSKEDLNTRPEMSNAAPPPSIPCELYSAGGLDDNYLIKFGSNDFNDAATPWEKKWSTLCKGAGTFTPVVVETTDLRKVYMATVAAHHGKVGSESLFQYGSPTMDRSNGWLGGDGMVFVAGMSDSMPPGRSTYGVPQTTYEVMTTVDGQVLAILGVVDREALQDANWIIDLVIAPLLAPALVQLASEGAARLCSTLLSRVEGRAARTLLAGPTGDLAKEASGLHFEVLSEGAPISGTSVPESLRLKVGESEFDISRNANKILPDTGQPIGPATKHLAEKVKNAPWNDLRVRKGAVIHETGEANVWSRVNQVDFPMSSLASGLQVAERQILKNALAPLEGTTGVYKVVVEGWEFMIDTTRKPWVVYHALIID